MDALQACENIKFLLNQRLWEGVGERVLEAYVTAAPTEEGLQDLRLPCAFITPLGGDVDPEEPGIINESIVVKLLGAVEGDEIGEEVYIGAQRSRGDQSSAGRGILEIQREIFEVITILERATGVTMQLRNITSVGPVQDESNQFIAGRDFTFLAWLTVTPTYAPALRFRGTDQGGGDVLLEWKNPPTTYDLHQIVVRRGTAGSPPTSPTDGTGVTLSGDLVESVTDSPGAGSYSYSLFVGYDDLGDGTNHKYSEAATISSVTVT